MHQASQILNEKDLARSPEREAVLEIMKAGLSAIDTELVITQHVRIQDSELLISGHTYDLSEIDNLYIVGFGKASCRAAATLEQVLTNNIDGGVVISNVESTCEIIDTYHGSHPRPSTTNVSATEKLVHLSENLSERDLVIVIVSGGGSALLCWPASECTQGQQLYDQFLTSGATIHELNTVRKHISKLKGGGLAKLLHPAEVVGLVFSDVPGGNYELIASGPTYYDHSTVADAQKIIQTYNLGDYDLHETPKDHKWFKRVTNIPLVSNQHALTAMKTKAETMGYNAIIAGHDFYDDLGDIANSLLDHSTEGTVVLGGGEGRLMIPADITPGAGGRNTHMTLHTSTKLNSQQVFCSFSSDGIDNCRAAGAIVDHSSVDRISRENLKTALETFDSYTALHGIGDTIITGPTETNVSDLYILLHEK